MNLKFFEHNWRAAKKFLTRYIISNKWHDAIEEGYEKIADSRFLNYAEKCKYLPYIMRENKKLEKHI